MRPGAFAVGLGLLISAWVAGNPLGAAPDEPSHYVKALGVGAGDWAGRPFVPTPAERRAFARSLREGARSGGSGTLSWRGLVWFARTTRSFRMPPRLSDIRFHCGWRRPARFPDCRRPAPLRSSLPSGTGTYPPYVYLLPGTAMLAARTPGRALLTGRVVLALVCLALLAAAGALLWDPASRGLSLSGLFAGVTPMVLFTASVLSASGVEIASGACFTAAGVRALRAPPTRAVWIALAVSGAILAVARTLGPPFVVLVALAVLVHAGRDRVVATLRGREAPAAVVGIVLLGAMAAGALWAVRHQPRPPLSAGDLWGEVGPSVLGVRAVLRQLVGDFGWLDTPLPTPVFAAWLVLGAALVAIAVRVSPGRRRTLIALLVGGAAFVVAASVLERQTGHPPQGRHLLPVLVALPILFGESVVAERRRLSRGETAVLAVGLPVGAALLQALAWYVNARISAVGPHGPWAFAGAAEWLPPGGWWPWFAVVALGAAAYASPGWTELRRSYRGAWP